MIWCIYLISILYFLLVFKITLKDKSLGKRVFKAVTISTLITIIFCSVISYTSESVVIKEPTEFIPAEKFLEKEGKLETEEGCYKIDDSKVVLDTITGVSIGRVRVEVPKMGGLWWIGYYDLSECSIKYHMTNEIYGSWKTYKKE